MAGKDMYGCCLKSCALSPLLKSCARAEVKTAIPKSGLSKHSDRLVVSWKRNGEATFHQECWNKLLLASVRKNPKRKARRMTDDENVANADLSITDSEKKMILQANETVETFDSEEQLQKEAERITKLLKKAKHCVFFTGAGISTSAGLGDFRGKGGKWTEEDREKVNMDAEFDERTDVTDGATPTKRARTAKNSSNESQQKAEMPDEPTLNEDEEEIDYEHLRPTLTHECIQKLVELDVVKYLISQNCDGLHLLSGIDPNKISELHGNVFVEKCEKCNTRYERPFYVCDDLGDMYLEEVADFGKSDILAPSFMKKCHKCGLSHRTGRTCKKKACKGPLRDTIINFRDNLDEDILEKAYIAAKECDLFICLGTTLMVTPASGIVDMIKKPKRIVICNRQETEKDEESMKTDKEGNPLGGRVHGDCDIFMKHLMRNFLGVEEFEKFQSDIALKMKSYNKKRPVPSK